MIWIISSKLETSVLQETPLGKRKQCTEWENLHVNYITDKEQVSRICKELVQQ